MIEDPWFYFVAIPAVLIYGIGKGGLGGALGVIAVPLISLVIPAVKAAAILLPILMLMDIFAVQHHWRNADYNILKNMMPGACCGVLFAGLFLSYIPKNMIGATIGTLCIWFGLSFYISSSQSIKSDRKRTYFWSALSGFSSTTIHAGGGPASIYLLPLKLNKVSLIATMAVFFTVVNILKLFVFTAIGEFDKENILTSLVLMPLAPLGVWLGVLFLNKVNQRLIYHVCYCSLVISGGKLLWDSLPS
ncbi:sulfite exporter TauE/SafE family protein [Vibrio hibernica]|uniref:sulfite exporter TauE/SafE family protein n=1 Tax=Vibrio hibernica TaxID=2587465 RepID=UPI0039B082D3